MFKRKRKVNLDWENTETDPENRKAIEKQMEIFVQLKLDDRMRETMTSIVHDVSEAQKKNTILGLTILTSYIGSLLALVPKDHQAKVVATVLDSIKPEGITITMGDKKADLRYIG